ncbi:MAG: amidohydrolase, partial [Acidobacteria bacterium]
MKRLLTLAFLLTLACAVASAQTRGGQARAGGAAQDTLIRNATVLTASHGALPATDVLIRNGKIVAVGQNLKAPEGARVVDATGKFVSPGIIDPHSHSMMDGSVNECTKSVTSMANTRDILNPTAIDIYRELAGGTTAALLLHGSCNSIGGQSTTVKL